MSDAELLATVARLARSERTSTVDLIAHLAELGARRLYRGEGFSSLFTYCTGALRLSEHAAYHRIKAARVARRFPHVLDMLREGSLNLTTVKLLAPHLTGENHAKLLSAASRKTRRQVETLVAQHFPRPDVPSSVRKLPTPMSCPLLLDAASPLAAATQAPAPPASGDAMIAARPTPVPPPVLPVARATVTAPLARDRYEIRFTASGTTYEQLQLAKDLLTHAVPTGDVAEIMRRALALLVEDLLRKKFAASDRPRASGRSDVDSRYLPAAVRRAVWMRDGGRCVFTAESGRRCGERGFLEFHHVKPYAAGGKATLNNLALRCREHNAHEADLYYGPTRPGPSSRVRWRREEPSAVAAGGGPAPGDGDVAAVGRERSPAHPP